MNSGKWVSHQDLKPGMKIDIKDGWWTEYRGQWKYEVITYYKVVTDGEPIIIEKGTSLWVMKEE